MEENYTTIFYAGISNQEYGEKVPLIFKAEKKLKYPEGILQVYFCLLPEIKNGLFGKKKWKPKAFRKLLDNIIRRALEITNYNTLILSDRLYEMLLKEKRGEQDGSEKPADVPPELMKAHLRSFAPFHKICVSLPEESGSLPEEWLEELLEPYLSRINQAEYVGEKTEISEALEEYLYEEYGIIMAYAKKPCENSVYIDLSDTEPNGYKKWNRSESIKCLSRSETLKFLDTYVKNGYNTKVN